MRRIERGAAVETGVQIPRAGAQCDVEVHEAPGRHVEGRQAATNHPAVEDHGGLGSTLIGLQEFHDRVPTGLLLAIAREPHVDRELSRLRELPRGAEQEEQLSLVVGDAAAVEILAPDLRSKRR